MRTAHKLENIVIFILMHSNVGSRRIKTYQARFDDNDIAYLVEMQCDLRATAQILVCILQNPIRLFRKTQNIR